MDFNFLNFFIVRGHNVNELLQIMDDPCSYTLHKAIMGNFWDEEKEKNKKR